MEVDEQDDLKMDFDHNNNRSLKRRNNNQVNERTSRRMIRNLLAKYKGIFAATLKNFEQNTCNDVVLSLETGAKNPVSIQSNAVHQTDIFLFLTDHLKKGILRNSTSQWSSPVYTSKNDKQMITLKVDYSHINKFIEDFDYPIPDQAQLIDSITQSTFFSKLIVLDGVRQFKLNKASSDRTAFKTAYFGTFQFTTMQPSLKNADKYLQREMERIIFSDLRNMPIELKDLVSSSIKIYLDKILVHTKTLTDQHMILKYLFSRFGYYNIKLDSKSVICHKFIEFLNRTINTSGITVDWRAKEVIKCLKMITNNKMLEEQLNFFRSYHNHYSDDSREIFKQLQRYQETTDEKYFSFERTIQINELVDALKMDLICPNIIAFKQSK